MKLFTIGDSISQGFMSGAAAHTNLSYSTLLARALGVADYRHASYPNHGLFVPLEQIMRRLSDRFGSNINPAEWMGVTHVVNEVLDASEDYYERGRGALDEPDPSGSAHYHNVAAFGLTVADAWQLTPNLCRDELREERTLFGPGADGYMAIANQSFYRSALHVLNPSRDWNTYGDHSQLEWLRTHAEHEGVENLVLWLGGNNALKSILGLEIVMTPGNPEAMAALDHFERLEHGWTLWHPNDFRIDYQRLIDGVHDAMESQSGDAPRNVFVGTIPAITIAPVIKGVGRSYAFPRGGDQRPAIYFKYYTYFPFEEDYAARGGMALTLDEARFIDEVIAEYNRIIRELVAAKNAAGGKTKYHVVDLAKMLDEMAYKRNDGFPTYEWPEAFRFRFPRVNTKYYHADSGGMLQQGGIVSLDGVHPTAIGQGLIARQFLKAFEEAGVTNAAGNVVSDGALDWDAIFESDLLYGEPLRNMQEIYQHRRLAELLVSILRGLLRG